MRKTQFWKRYAGAIALLILPVLGKADVIMDWNAIMQAIVSTQPPFPQARFAAITQLAVFEAVNAISHRDTRSYAGHTIFDSCVRLRQPSLTTGAFFGGSLAP